LTRLIGQWYHLYQVKIAASVLAVFPQRALLLVVLNPAMAMLFSIAPLAAWRVTPSQLSKESNMSFP